MGWRAKFPRDLAAHLEWLWLKQSLRQWLIEKLLKQSYCTFCGHSKTVGCLGLTVFLSGCERFRASIAGYDKDSSMDQQRSNYLGLSEWRKGLVIKPDSRSSDA